MNNLLLAAPPCQRGHGPESWPCVDLPHPHPYTSYPDKLYTFFSRSASTSAVVASGPGPDIRNTLYKYRLALPPFFALDHVYWWIRFHSSSFPSSSSGKLSPTSTESTRPVTTTEIMTSSWSASTCTTPRSTATSMSRGRSSSIWSRAPWTRCASLRTEPCSDRITTCTASPEREITGLRVTTQRVPSWLTTCSTWYARSPKPAIVCRASSWHTRSAVVPVPVWAHCSSARSARNTPTG